MMKSGCLLVCNSSDNFIKISDFSNAFKNFILIMFLLFFGLLDDLLFG